MMYVAPMCLIALNGNKTTLILASPFLQSSISFEFYRPSDVNSTSSVLDCTEGLVEFYRSACPDDPAVHICCAVTRVCPPVYVWTLTQVCDFLLILMKLKLAQSGVLQQLLRRRLVDASYLARRLPVSSCSPSRWEVIMLATLISAFGEGVNG